jgi:integrase
MPGKSASPSVEAGGGLRRWRRRSGGALRRRVAAIARRRRSTGHSWQAGHAAIRQTLTGIGREHHRPVRPAAALISTDVKRLITVCPGDLAGLRDRALFLVGLAGAFRRSELVGIDVTHLRFEAIGVRVRIPRSKTDQEGEGVDIVLPYELIKAVAQDSCSGHER